jgi:hypothetical protein
MSEHADLRQLIGLWGKYGVVWIQKHLQAQGALLGGVAYLVWRGDYEDRDVVAVYARADLAARHAAAMAGTSVQEQPVDVDLPPHIVRGEKSWFVRVDLADGRLLNKALWDRMESVPLEVVYRAYPPRRTAIEEETQLPEALPPTEFEFQWTGWATEEKLLEVVEDARQAWVAKYGIAEKPPEPRYVAPPRPAVELVREKEARTRLEEMYRDLQEGLEAKAAAGVAGARLAADLVAQKGVLTPAAIAGLAVQSVVREAVEAEAGAAVLARGTLANRAANGFTCSHGFTPEVDQHGTPVCPQCRSIHERD